ncbi:MAG: GNAT family N-acetyltransferase [Pseudomonadota bacterium]|nr:GNAT family N-acetyltransferase [Pseudomonadota bacterium]
MDASDCYIETTVTYLEMFEQPVRPSPAPPMGKHAILHAEHPTVSFYRYLYHTVGEPWTWTDRRILSDEALCEIIHDPLVEIYVLHIGGVPAGFVELDRRIGNEVEMCFVGLMPEFTGRGLGNYMLDWAIHAAWSSKPTRVWLHTCDLDHPRALPLYQRAGFSAYKRQVEKVMSLEAVARIEAPSDGESG